MKVNSRLYNTYIFTVFLCFIQYYLFTIHQTRNISDPPNVFLMSYSPIVEPHIKLQRVIRKLKKRKKKKNDKELHV